MALGLPQRRVSVRNVNIPQRQIPIEQIIAVKGQDPLAIGIEELGSVLGQAIERRAELRKRGEELAALERLAGKESGAFEGLDPSTAAALTKMSVENTFEDKKPKPSSNPRYQFAGLDEEGNPVVFNPLTGNLETGGRSGSAGALMPKQKKILPGGILQDIKNQESAISLLESAAATSPEIMERSVGLIGGKVAPAVAKIPLVGKPFRDPERAVFQQNVKTGLLKFLYSEAGKQLSDPERIAVQDAIGSVDTPIEEFKPKLDGAIRIIKGAQERYQQSLGGSGYIVPTGGLKPIEERKPMAITPKKVGRFIIEEE